jgi:subtilisin family serine protease
MLLIGAPKVWESDAGGLTPRGDTIVVAVLEKGILFTHPDLEGNRWYNHEEIPDNDLDDDQNGYVDDFRGWNPRTSADDTGTNGNHGTAVTGIIGAVGNNAIGVAGVNWKVKMMSICQVEFEDEIIAAYQYVNTQRKRYNQSNGTQGAFVVATNASFGIDNAKPEDHPVWCAVYDSLGKSGILNIGATTNQNTDVEAEGDMPTRCTSPYLIAVNNVNKLGVKEPATGYGAVSIDLGAPGTDTYTTSNAGTNLPSYGKLGGTSAATPHVTGAVGLLYSLDCPTFTSDALANPEQCAARVRDAILLNTEPEASLTGITTTGGYLQVAKAMQSVIDYCKGTVGILDILEIRTRPDYRQFQAYYQTPTYENYGFEVHHMSGQLMFAETLKPQRFQPNYVEIDASSYPPGVYVMTLSKGFAKVSRKFIKI